MRLLLPVLLLVAGPAAAQADEDAAHRADRLRTRHLNEAALGRSPRPATAGRAQQAYRRALDDYETRLEDWRRRVAACEAGRYEACQ